MKQYERPYLIDFRKIGETQIGYISVAENKLLPFQVQRIFWTYFTPESIVRGRHAHYETEQILVAVSGRIIVSVEDNDGKIDTFILDNPNIGLYIPPCVWHTMQYSHTAVQMALSSTEYSEKDYIRDYSTFKKVWAGPMVLNSDRQ